jgi:hypothetical protein
MSRSSPFPYRGQFGAATRNSQEGGGNLEFLIGTKFFAMFGSITALLSYLFAQASSAVSSNAVPDAVGTTVLTVGGGGLMLYVAAISRDFWTYKKEQMQSRERLAKEERESQERIETARLSIEKLKVTSAHNSRRTEAVQEWMETAHRTQSFPPPPPREEGHNA